MKNRFFFFLCFFVFIVTACTHDLVNTTGSLSGIIRDANDNSALQGASVVLSPLGNSTTTGNDGHYQFTDVEKGTYTVSVTKADYESTSKSVIVEMEKNTTLDFVLYRASSTISVSPLVLDFGDTDTNLRIDIQNKGKATMSWQIAENISWLTCTPVSGDVLAGQTGSVTVTVKRDGLSVGTYENTMTVMSKDGGSQTVRVSMKVDVNRLVPTVNMIAANPTDVSATLTGTLTSIGSSAVTDYGFYWSTNPNIPIEDVKAEIRNSTSNNKASLGSANEPREKFEYTLSNLTANTVYYVYAYATNAVGTAVSNKIDFTTTSTQGPPQVETGVALPASNSASVSGNILDLGCIEGVDRYGHCWSSTVKEPTVDYDKTNLGELKQPGSFTSTLTNLKPNTLYYVRAYAHNKYATVYGKVIQFTTLLAEVKLTTNSATDITHNEATCGGRITEYGGNNIIERGVCWGTSANPTLANNYSASSDDTDLFSVRLTNLTEQTSYHVRAYVKTSSNETYYGQDVSFTTTKVIVLPQASTVNVTNITATSVTVSASVLDDGNGTIKDKGFCYSTTSSPTIDDNKKSCGRTSTFSTTLSGLSDDTRYYVRSYVTNERGTGYGEQTEFRTLPITLPTLSNVAVSGVTFKAATFEATVTSLGNGTIKRSGFCYGTSHNPTVNNTVASCGTKTNLKTSVSSLSAETTYYVRAFAENEKGVAYGEEQTFTTPSGSNVKREDWEEDENWNF